MVGPIRARGLEELDEELELGGFSMPGVFPTGFFFRRFVWSRIFFLLRRFFFETQPKNVMKKKIDASVMDFWSL